MKFETHGAKASRSDTYFLIQLLFEIQDDSLVYQYLCNRNTCSITEYLQKASIPILGFPDPTEERVRFSDVAGADEEKQELIEIVDFLKDNKQFKQMGSRIHKGVLLVGPPGTGKTLLARAVAGGG